MDKKAAAAEIKRLRAQSKDKSIPQEARNEMLDRANAIELKFYDKAVKDGETMAKGGAVKKKGYMYGGDATKMNGMHKMPDGSMMKDSAMAKGGAVKKKPAAKKTASRQSPVIAVMIGMTDKKKPAKKMAKGGYANCGASVKAAGSK
jgi:hypothetical protein